MSRRELHRDADKGLLAATAVITFLAALGVSGGTHAWMMLIDHDLIKKHRATLTFRSAIFGDGIILPVVNLLIMKSLKKWSPRIGAGTLLPVVGGSAVSLMFHIGQGRGGLVNWTMPKPWRWNLLGYYHFVFMSTQFAYLLLYLQNLAGSVARQELTDAQKKDLALIAANMAAFGILLYTDYY